MVRLPGQRSLQIVAALCSRTSLIHRESIVTHRWAELASKPHLRWQMDASLVEALTQALVAQGVSIPSVTVQHVATIPKTAAGKAPLIKAKSKQ